MYSLFVYPILRITSLAISCTSRYALDFTSPARTTCPVVTNVSHATLLCGSNAKKLSISASLIWSATLSGCPSLTDSDVNKSVSYTHLRAHETGRNLVCRLLLEKKKKKTDT